ncbi:MAG: zinc ribbon domain-containing protein [Firmicutes bacterium]|nr:zinc ribbon domain-containing protein [Bacillota bacterium]
MPIYEFRCPECEHKFEELCKSSAEEVPCPKCGSAKTARLFSPFGFAVAGGGHASGSSSGCSSCGGGHCSTCH